MTQANLTQRQARVYECLRRFVAERGYPPTLRELMQELGFKSPSSVHAYLAQLEQLGYIRRDVSKSRALELLVDAGCPTGANHDLDTLNAVRLPLLGRVAAGEPIVADGSVEEYVTLPHSLVGDDASFVLKVKGDSMVGAGIFDGDFVVVREQHDAANGEIVVALLGDEATVKTFYREKGRIRLQPENPTMQPIYTDNPRILGRVVALLRTL